MEGNGSMKEAIKRIKDAKDAAGLKAAFTAFENQHEKEWNAARDAWHSNFKNRNSMLYHKEGGSQ